MNGDVIGMVWRSGRHRPRHIYAQVGPVPDDLDQEVVFCETEEIAAHVIASHNAGIGGATE